MLNPASNRPGVHGRPQPGTLTGRVWEIADDITREKGRRAERREVIERYVAENGNRNTAGTQFQYWKKHHEEPRSVSTPALPGRLRDVEPQPLKVTSDGRVLIPLDLREAMVLGEDGRVTARVEAESFVSFLQRLRFDKYRPACGSSRSRGRASSTSSWRNDAPCGERNEPRLRQFGATPRSFSRKTVPRPRRDA